MISFMWRMWFSSMSWNFCKTGRAQVMAWWCRKSFSLLKSNKWQVNKSASWCQTRLYRHENRKTNMETSLSLPYSASARFLCVCLGGLWRTHTHTQTETQTYTHTAPPIGCKLFCSTRYIDGGSFLALNSSMVQISTLNTSIYFHLGLTLGFWG